MLSVNSLFDGYLIEGEGKGLCIDKDPFITNSYMVISYLTGGSENECFSV